VQSEFTYAYSYNTKTVTNEHYQLTRNGEFLVCSQRLFSSERQIIPSMSGQVDLNTFQTVNQLSFSNEAYSHIRSKPLQKAAINYQCPGNQIGLCTVNSVETH